MPELDLAVSFSHKNLGGGVFPEILIYACALPATSRHETPERMHTPDRMMEERWDSPVADSKPPASREYDFTRLNADEPKPTVKRSLKHT